MLRYLPLIIGSIGGLGLILNRIVTTDLTPSQSRSDALGIAESALLVLVSLLWQQVEPKPPEAVELQGNERFFMEASLPQALQTELAWLSHTLITHTVTRSIVIWYDGAILHQRGIFPAQTLQTPGTIGKRVMEKQQPVYLVQLSLYPGKIEFDYLPENTQGVIIHPLGLRGLMVLGAYVPRSYTRQDEAWIKSLAEKISFSLSALSLPELQGLQVPIEQD